MGEPSEPRLSRRAVMAGISAATLPPAIAWPGAATAQVTPDQRAGTPAATPETSMRPLLSANEMWETFGSRAIAYTAYGGADIGECTSTVQRVGDDGTVDDWYREWMATGTRVAGFGDDSAARGHTISAREAYLRATNYFHVAYMPLIGAPVDSRLLEAYDRQVQTFEKGAALLDSPFEPVEIPFEGTTLPGYLFTVDDSGAPRRTVVHTNGYDSTIQEMYFAHAPAALRRGYNVLLFDGPGQGRNLIRDGMTIRPDWENVVTPVIDYALTRPEIDAERIVLTGWSLGGLLAPRAAGVEHRIAALVADPGQWDLREAVLPMLPLDGAAREAFPDIDPSLLDPMQAWLESPEADPMMRWQFIQRGFWVHGVDSVYDYLAALVKFEVSSVAGDIACPTLITAAEGDPLAARAPKLFDAIGATNKELVRFTQSEGASGHCESFARTLYHQRVYDWLDETLGA